MSGNDNASVRLLVIAEAQQGYFTTKQAIEAGYADNTHPYHIRAGNWKRMWRGLYRLRHYPVAEDGEMVLWYLWSRDRNERPQGIYSHQTVLSVFELSDVMPSKLHLTVPPGFRRNSEIPKVLVLHRGLVSNSDIQRLHGFSVTRVLRAILDCAREGKVAADQLALALEQGQKRGMITARELGSARQQKDAKTLLNRILG